MSSFKKEFLINNGCQSFEEYRECNALLQFKRELPNALDSAWSSCGLVYELGQENFSFWVESFIRKFSPRIQNRIKEEARKHGYLTSEERDELSEGLCAHYIEPKYCPAGCGEF